MITKILCLSDGRPGNQRPLELLCSELSKHFQAEQAHLKVDKTPWRRLGNQLESTLLGLAPKHISEIIGHLPPHADKKMLVITCGRTALPYGRFLQRQHRVKLVHILNPYGNVKQFDAVVLPKHDRITGPNIVHYQLGLTQKPRPNDASVSFMKNLPNGPILALIVGGSNAHQHISTEDIQMWKMAIRKHMPDLAGLAITFSRRTQPETKTQVLEAFSDYPCCFYDGKGPNPYPGFLALASHAAVTIDSMNMLADVAASKCPMMLLSVSGSQPKFDAVVENLMAKGRAGHLSFGSNVTAWDELPEVAQTVASLLLGNQTKAVTTHD